MLDLEFPAHVGAGHQGAKTDVSPAAPRCPRRWGGGPAFARTGEIGNRLLKPEPFTIANVDQFEIRLGPARGLPSVAGPAGFTTESYAAWAASAIEPIEVSPCPPR